MTDGRNLYAGPNRKSLNRLLSDFAANAPNGLHKGAGDIIRARLDGSISEEQVLDRVFDGAAGLFAKEIEAIAQQPPLHQWVLCGGFWWTGTQVHMVVHPAPRAQVLEVVSDALRARLSTPPPEGCVTGLVSAEGVGTAVRDLPVGMKADVDRLLQQALAATPGGATLPGVRGAEGGAKASDEEAAEADALQAANSRILAVLADREGQAAGDVRFAAGAVVVYVDARSPDEEPRVELLDRAEAAGLFANVVRPELAAGPLGEREVLLVVATLFRRSLFVVHPELGLRQS